MSLYWSLVFVSGIVSIQGFIWGDIHVDCNHPENDIASCSFYLVLYVISVLLLIAERLKAEYLPDHANCDSSAKLEYYCQHHHSSGQSSSGSSSSSTLHHTGSTDDFGCNNVEAKNRVNLLWKDWHKNHDDDVVKQLYADILVSMQSEHSHNTLPGNRRMTKRKTVHDEAYYHFNRDPDYPHIRDLVYNYMNDKCRMEIIDEMTNALPNLITTLAPTTTTHKPHHHHTHAPHTTHHQNHHTHAPKTSAPTSTPRPTTARPTTRAPATTAQPKITTANVPLVNTQSPTNQPQQVNTTYKCDLLQFVTALAHNDLLIDPSAGMCTDGTHTQSEALVTGLCNVPKISEWKQGVNVVSNCKAIPPYTPIGMFVFGSYVTSGTELSGILVECTADGFKAAFQLCGHSPRIYSLKHGASDSRQDANSYYVIA